MFDQIWQAHWDWCGGLLLKSEEETTSATIYLSEIPGEYYNFAVPSTDSINKFDLKEIDAILRPLQKKSAVYLLEKHQKEGFVEHLVRNDYKLESRDTWMIYDKTAAIAKASKVKQITPQEFNNFKSVLGKVFSDFAGNEKYLEICQKSLEGEIKSNVPDTKSELYLVYDHNLPVAGAAMFYSRKEDIAYLHNDGTLEKYRGHGYQTELINFRTKRALDMGTSRIYAIVEQGSQSWKNYINCGFYQAQVANLFVNS